MNPFIPAISLIIHVLFDGYVVILLLRFMLQKLGANWHNPLSQFVIQLTEKPLKPCRKIAPGINGFDTAILLLAFVIQFIEVILLCALQFPGMHNVIGTAIVSVGEILSKFIYIYTYAIIINAIGSWVPQTQSHPMMHAVYLIVEPLLSRIRNFIPLIAGIDISPIFALLGLTLINMLLVSTILAIGTHLILG